MNGRLLALVAICAASPVAADSIGAAFSSTWAFNAIGAPAGLNELAGVTIDPNNPNVMLIGANSGTASGVIESVGLTRDPITHRITGYSTSAAVYAFAPDIDGGLAIAPDDDLLFTQYPTNAVAELKPGSTTPDKTVSLTSLQASTGGLAFIPAGFNGAGNVAISSYNHGVICSAAITADGSGTYNIGNCASSVTLGGLVEGILYVPSGTDGFTSNTILIATYSSGGASSAWALTAYRVDGNGLPVVSTAATLFTGNANEGLTLDPVTGDIIATTYSIGAATNVYNIYDAAQTPEPASVWLCLTGLATLLAAWSRRVTVGR